MCCVTKEIENTDGNYFADEDGNVYSVSRYNTKGGKLEGALRGKYLSVSICVNGRVQSKNIHRLIAFTFIPNPFNLPEINHKNGNKFDNRKLNLEWADHVANSKHLYEVLGYVFLGKKLTKDNVFEILSNPTTPTKDFSKKFNVTNSTIHYLRRGDTFKPYIKEFNSKHNNYVEV